MECFLCCSSCFCLVLFGSSSIVVSPTDYLVSAQQISTDYYGMLKTSRCVRVSVRTSMWSEGCVELQQIFRIPGSSCS